MDKTVITVGTEGRYSLTPEAEANLKEVLPHVNEKLGSDIKDFVTGLRENFQSDVTLTLAYLTKALRAMPANKHVENAVWNFFLLEKEQITGTLALSSTLK